MSYRLYNLIDQLEETEYVQVILKFNNDVDFEALKKNFNELNIPPKQRAAKVVMAYEQNFLLNVVLFENYLTNSNMNAAYQPIPIANSITLISSKNDLQKILDYKNIVYADINEISIVISDPPSRSGNSETRSPGGHEPGHDIINAPALWAMGYSGAGTTLLSFDTGFWPAHPAIGNKYKGNSLPQDQCWFPYDLDSPGDKSNSHGTHTIGTVLGLDTATNDTIGVAPGAYFIATDPIVSNVADIKTWEELAMGFEWALNPDGDLNTFEDVPDVINNSWGRPVEGDVEPCEEIMINIFSAIEAAGIANVFSAGNSGPDPLTISAPHNINQGLVNSFTVGAVNLNSNLSIAGFSSRGPSLCGGDSSILIKPEVVAPGVNIRSAVNQDEYDNYQGTSMAAPHVSGAVLLLREAFPLLTGEEILLALYYSALDLGDPGEDNVYGNGIVDALAAYNYLIDEGNIPTSPINNNYEIAITEVISPQQLYQCHTTINPEFKVKNFGDSTITNIEVSYEMIGTSEQSTQLINTTLLANQEVMITLDPFVTSIVGPFELLINVQLPDDQLENDYLNNQRIIRGNIRPIYDPDPTYLEEFEDGISPIDWFVFNDDGAITWDTISTAGLVDSESSAFMEFYKYSPKLNQKDELISPLFDITDQEESLELRFNYAYQRRGNSSTLKDTLRVFVSNNCGETWNLHWEAYADSLKTIPNNSTLAFFPDSIQDWGFKSIVLNNYLSNSQEIMFKFQTANRNGNNLFLDNVELHHGNAFVGIYESTISPLKISPNPSSGIFEILLGEFKNKSFLVHIIDSKGSRVSPTQNRFENKLLLDMSEYSSGIYTVFIFDDTKLAKAKIVKQ